MTQSSVSKPKIRGYDTQTNFIKLEMVRMQVVHALISFSLI
jgi:hypothetical protein